MQLYCSSNCLNESVSKCISLVLDYGDYSPAYTDEDYLYDYNYDDEEELTCCAHQHILPAIIKVPGLTSCGDKNGYKCVDREVK